MSILAISWIAKRVFVALIVMATLSLLAVLRASTADEAWTQEVMDAVVGFPVSPSAHQQEHLCAAIEFRTGWRCEDLPIEYNLAMPWLVDAVNDARATGRWCGTEWMPAQAPLRWSWELQEAARDAVRDMLAKGYRGHTSPSGMDARKWGTSRGYAFWIQDDLAFGPSSFSEGQALRAWLADPPHCRPIMESQARDVAGYFENGVWALYLGWDGTRY